MNQPQPKTKALDLLNQVIGLSLEDRNSEFMLKRLAREAKSSVSVDPINSYMSLGIIAFFENNPSNVKKFFSLLIHKYPEDAQVFYNYSVTLYKTGQYKNSLRYANNAYDLAPADPNHIYMSCLLNILSGNYEIAMERLLFAEKARLVNDKLSLLDAICFYLRSNGIINHDFIKLQDLAYSLAHSSNIFIMSPSLEICEDEDSAWLSYQILLDKPISEILDLSVLLAEKLAKSPFLNDISNKINISFAPWCE